MHSSNILSNFLKEVCPKMHSKRRKSLESVLESCLNQGSLGVTSLGRGISRESLEKHRIKQADRLLSNSHLQDEIFSIYRELASKIISGLERVVILIDWSNLDQNQRHFLLRASVALKGRSITIYEEVHTLKTKEKLKTHKKFLRNLERILPEGVIPILVSDAGFRITWFKEVRKLGWDWVGRIRGIMKVKETLDSQWVSASSLHPRANQKGEEFATARIGKQNNLDSRLVLYKDRPKGRVMKNKFGNRRVSVRTKKAETAGREPWLLSTSLEESLFPTNKIVEIYFSRMQIEESFRDMKSSQYGIGLAQARTYKTKRMRVLVLLATLENTFAWMLGKAVSVTKQAFAFQANTVKTKAVLSLVFLGRQFFRQNRIKIYYKQFLHVHIHIKNLSMKTCFL